MGGGGCPRGGEVQGAGEQVEGEEVGRGAGGCRGGGEVLEGAGEEVKPLI